jgi:hypothetical protein
MLREHLLRAHERGDPLTREGWKGRLPTVDHRTGELRDNGVPHANTISSRLGGGSWNAAKESVGIPVNQSGWQGQRQTEEEMILSLQECAEELAHPPTEREWNASGRRPGLRTLQKRFGSFNAAKEKAGLSTNGQCAPGERSAHAKLTAEAVREIRASAEGPTALARRFGVHPTTIQRVRNGQSWQHVKGDEEV